MVRAACTYVRLCHRTTAGPDLFGLLIEEFPCILLSLLKYVLSYLPRIVMG
jgi:hypothetical protein